MWLVIQAFPNGWIQWINEYEEITDKKKVRHEVAIKIKKRRITLNYKIYSLFLQAFFCAKVVAKTHRS